MTAKTVRFIHTAALISAALITIGLTGYAALVGFLPIWLPPLSAALCAIVSGTDVICYNDGGRVLRFRAFKWTWTLIDEPAQKRRQREDGADASAERQ